jgi:RND family efflux transporter MFP subunit
MIKCLTPYLTATLSSVIFLAAANAQDNSNNQKAITTFNGVISVAKDYSISPEINNKIKRIYFVEGQLVRRGDLLVEFDTEEKLLEVAYAKASYERAHANLKLAQDRLQRSNKLKSKSIVSLSKHRETQLNVEIVAADEKLAKVTLEKAELVLKEQKLYAPFDGQMTAPNYSENTNIEVTIEGEIAKIVQLDPIHVRYSMTYPYLAKRLREKGSGAEKYEREKVRFRLKFPDGSTYEHLENFVAAKFRLDTETGMLPAIAEFPNPEFILVPGLKVSLDAIER